MTASAAKQAAEKVSRFVGRAFRHDIKSAFPSRVLTPEGPKVYFSATFKADFGEIWFGLTKARASQASRNSLRSLPYLNIGRTHTYIL